MTPDQIETLEALRGTFVLGHTDDDVTSVGQDLLETLGVHIVVVWAFDDMWGFGGESDVFIAEGFKLLNLYEAPDCLYRFLYYENGDNVTIEELQAAKHGKRVRKPPYRPEDHNWCWRYAPTKELG